MATKTAKRILPMTNEKQAPHADAPQPTPRADCPACKGTGRDNGQACKCLSDEYFAEHNPAIKRTMENWRAAASRPAPAPGLRERMCEMCDEPLGDTAVCVRCWNKATAPVPPQTTQREQIIEECAKVAHRQWLEHGAESSAAEAIRMLAAAPAVEDAAPNESRNPTSECVREPLPPAKEGIQEPGKEAVEDAPRYDRDIVKKLEQQLEDETRGSNVFKPYRLGEDATPRTPLHEAVLEMMPLIEFYAKREMESPSNNQEAVRDTREELGKLRAALAASTTEKDTKEKEE